MLAMLAQIIVPLPHDQEVDREGHYRVKTYVEDTGLILTIDLFD